MASSKQSGQAHSMWSLIAGCWVPVAALRARTTLEPAVPFMGTGATNLGQQPAGASTSNYAGVRAFARFPLAGESDATFWIIDFAGIDFVQFADSAVPEV